MPRLPIYSNASRDPAAARRMPFQPGARGSGFQAGSFTPKSTGNTAFTASQQRIALMATFGLSKAGFQRIHLGAVDADRAALQQGAGFALDAARPLAASASISEVGCSGKTSRGTPSWANWAKSSARSCSTSLSNRLSVILWAAASAAWPCTSSVTCSARMRCARGLPPEGGLRPRSLRFPRWTGR